MILRTCITAIMTSLLAACSSHPPDRQPAFSLVTAPAGAECLIQGRNGFAATLLSPATVTLPVQESPLEVRCSAAGHRTIFALVMTRNNEWVWVSPNAPIVSLERDRPRELRIVERVAGQPIRPRPTW
jgi:hypothetical protein